MLGSGVTRAGHGLHRDSRVRHRGLHILSGTVQDRQCVWWSTGPSEVFLWQQHCAKHFP